MKHPAKFSWEIVDAIADALDEFPVGSRILDPFAGTGRIHLFSNFDTVGVEIEPEWANMHPRTLVGDATCLPFADNSFDLGVTSVTYGNRMADHHDARDASRRNTYTHVLRTETGDPSRHLHDNNTGKMHWGEQYREMHRRAYSELGRVVRPDGVILLNVSDFIADGAVVGVAAWHRDACELWANCDPFVTRSREIGTQRNRHGANGDLRVDCEMLYRLVRY